MREGWAITKKNHAQVNTGKKFRQAPPSTVNMSSEILQTEGYVGKKKLANTNTEIAQHPPSKIKWSVSYNTYFMRNFNKSVSAPIVNSQKPDFICDQ